MSVWSAIDGQSQANYLKRTYASFMANTVRGTLVFSGTGAVVASEVEQRAIAEWAFARWEEANTGYLSADIGLILSWSEESTSLCGSLWVYRTGLAVAWDCRGSDALSVGFLPAAYLQQFYKWLDSGKRWNISRTDQAEGKSRKVTLYFPWSGSGESAAAEDNENMIQFARQVYTELTQVPQKQP